MARSSPLPSLPDGAGAELSGRIAGQTSEARWSKARTPRTRLWAVSGRQAVDPWAGTELAAGVPGGAAPGLVTARTSQPTPECGDAESPQKPARPKPYIPKSCSACEAEAIHLEMWKRSDPLSRSRAPFKCRSWRHSGACARFVTQRDYARLREALKRRHISTMTFLVLTYDPRTAPKSLDAQFEELQPRWQALERLIKRGFGGAPGVGKFEYSTYVEGHRSGAPHMNVLIISRQFAQYLRDNPPTESDLDPEASHGGTRAPRWFRSLAAHAGFGPLCSLRHARSKDAVASYVTKFDSGAVMHPALQGEVTKMSQLPIYAPRRFRRTRSSKGFLPPIHTRSDEPKEWTGKIVMAPLPAVQLDRQQEGLRALREHLDPTRNDERNDGSGDAAAAPRDVLVRDVQRVDDGVPGAGRATGGRGNRVHVPERSDLPGSARGALRRVETAVPGDVPVDSRPSVAAQRGARRAEGKEGEAEGRSSRTQVVATSPPRPRELTLDRKHQIWERWFGEAAG